MAYADEIAQLQRRRALAQVLMQQGMQPQGQMAGRFYAGPTTASTLGSLASIIGGSMLDRKISKQEKAVTDTERSRLADVLRGLAGDQMAATPAVSAPAMPAPSPPPPDVPPNGVAGSAGPPSPGPSLPGKPALAPTTPALTAAPPAMPMDPKRAAALSVLQGLPVEQIQGLVGQAAVTNLFPKPKDDFTLGKGDVRYSATGQKLAEGMPDSPPTPAEIQGYNLAKQQGFTGSYLEYQTALKKAGATSINLPEQKYPNAFNEALGKADVETLTGYQKAATSSANMVKTLDQLQKLNPTAMSGGGADTRAEVSNWLSGWTGINVTDPKVLADTQAYNAVTSKAILDSLGGSLGSGVSNADVTFIKNTVPKLEYSKEARQQLIDYLRKRATDNIDLYSRAREYGEAHGGLKGFNAYPVANPQAGGAIGKLTRNPDGTITYSP